LFHPSFSYVEKFVEINGEIIFQPKWQDIARKLSLRAYLGIRKAQKCTITPVIYNGSAKSRW